MRLETRTICAALVAAGVFAVFFHFSYARLNTADSSIYLSTAENIANHRGFVASYNLCQCFNTLYHPIWAYYQPMFALLCSLFIKHGGIVSIIQLNILFFSLNAALIFYLMQRYMPTRFNILFIFFLVFSFNFFVSSVYAWTEQFHFFCFLITFILFLKYQHQPRILFGLGIFNALFMLVRVAHMYNFLAYFPVFFLGNEPFRQKINRAAAFAGGFILAYGAYQLFCLGVYHVFYPEYAKPGADYGIARLYSGIVYQDGQIGLHVPAQSLLTLPHLRLVVNHFLSFCHELPLFVWPALCCFFLPTEKRAEDRFIELCLFQSAFLMAAYSLTFYWLPSHFFEAVRYSLIPYVLVSMAGWYCFYRGLSLSMTGMRKAAGVLVMAVLIWMQFNGFMNFEYSLLRHPLWSRPYYRDLSVAAGWIDQRLPEGILIASNEDQQGYFMHRPFISTPPGRSFNCPNLALFNHIYAPDYYLLSSDIDDVCFSGIPHQVVFYNNHFRVLEIKKNHA